MPCRAHSCDLPTSALPDDEDGMHPGCQPEPDTIRVYVTSDTEPDVGATDYADVTPDVAARLDAEGLTYTPDDAPGTRYTYVGKGDATWQRLTALDAAS